MHGGSWLIARLQPTAFLLSYPMLTPSLQKLAARTKTGTIGARVPIDLLKTSSTTPLRIADMMRKTSASLMTTPLMMRRRDGLERHGLAARRFKVRKPSVGLRTVVGAVDTKLSQANVADLSMTAPRPPSPTR